MPQAATLRVDGYRQTMQALALADKATRRAWRAELAHAGDKVRTDASSLAARYDQKTAAGYRTRVRQRGIAVEQSLRKTTGRHPEFGTLQMRRVLLPALAANERDTVRAVEDALDRICDRFNHGGAL